MKAETKAELKEIMQFIYCLLFIGFILFIMVYFSRSWEFLPEVEHNPDNWMQWWWF